MYHFLPIFWLVLFHKESWWHHALFASNKLLLIGGNSFLPHSSVKLIPKTVNKLLHQVFLRCPLCQTQSSYLKITPRRLAVLSQILILVMTASSVVIYMFSCNLCFNISLIIGMNQSCWFSFSRKPNWTLLSFSVLNKLQHSTVCL